jgi:hypothetical protein
MSIKQNFPTIDSSLNLDFANSRVVDQRIQFTRASAATVTDALGVLQTVRDNKPRIDFDAATGECRGLLIEEQRTNMFAHSENINTATWAQFVEAIVTPNAIIAPNGTQTAFKVTANTVNYPHGVGQTFGPTNLATYTVSIYAKKGELDAFRIFAWYGGAWVAFNLTSGTVTSTSGGVTSAISSVGNGWYRCSMTWTASGSDGIRFSLSDNYPNDYWAGNGTSGLYFWGPQVEPGTFATSYISSNTSFTSRAGSAYYYDSVGTLRIAPPNQPRYGYGYDSTTNKWVSQGLILEPAATNLITRSDMQANWGIPNVAYTYSTATTAPDGSVIYSINKNTSYQLIRMSLFNAATISYPATYTLSFWAKTLSGTGSLIWDIGDGIGTATGAASLTTTWQRFTYTMTAASAATFPSGGFIDFTIPDNNTYAIWGVQFETGGTATSYIPTFGATATRAADVSASAATTRAQDKPSINSTNLLPLLDAYEGTIYSQGKFFGADSAYNNPTVYLNDGTASNYIALFNHASTYGWAQSIAGTQAGIAGISTSANTDYRLAFGYKVNDFAFCSNGGSVGTDVSGSVPNVNQMTIGYRLENQSFSYNGHIKKITYYPYRISNTQLQALTV